MSMDIIERALETAAANRHRRLFVVSGDWRKSVDVVAEILEKAKEYVGKKLLYVAEFPKESDIGERRMRALFRRVRGYQVNQKPFATARDVLGRTYDVAVIDAHENFPPREIGIIVETVRGPGLVVLWVPELTRWMSMKLKFHEMYVVTPPYSVEDCRNLYLSRVVRKLMEHEGVYILSDEGVIVKAPKEKKRRAAKKHVKLPTKPQVPQEILSLAATQDQINVVNALPNVLKGKRKALVILADRGRGKSAALGLFLASLVERGGRVIVTAPSFSNAEEIFKFVRKGLDALGIKYSARRQEIRAGNLEITFKEPLDVRGSKCDLLIVDEAAGIYVSLLKEFLRYDHIVFSTTTHGYEGTGRLFQYRFLPALQSSHHVEILRMSEPIRYAPNDPIEDWLYDVFLLDAEPEDLSQKDLEDVAEGKLVFEELDVERLFLRDDKTLRAFVGIYVFAHYRNNPKDIAILADAPNQRAFCVRTSTGKIVASLQVAEEGGLGDEHIQRMREGEIIQGNIVPDLIVKYYAYEDFAKKAGLRIVRIAVHPELQGRGIGSFALSELQKVAEKEGKSWYGAVFGASPRLLKFWLKNGFVPIHVSPKRNPESGEYSVLVIKPLDRLTHDIAGVTNFGMRLRLIYELDNFYRHMEPEVALLLLSSGKKRKIPSDLTVPERRKLEGFLEGRLFYDALSDVFFRLAVWYFMGEQKPDLKEEEKLWLIEKVLKKRTWKGAAETFGMDPMKFARKVDRVLTKIGREALS